jgi:small GTP-binding protein
MFILKMQNYSFKIVIIGDSSVGKSSIVSRLLQHRFNDNIQHTIGASYIIYNKTINDINIRFEIWDTAGQEKYNSITPLYYRKANIAIIVYDLTDINTFEKAKYWINEIRKNNEVSLYVLVANKYDIINDENNDLIKKGHIFAENNNMTFFITSAKTGKNISILFDEIACNMIINKKNIINKKEEFIVLNNKSNNNINTLCCL